MIRPMNPRPIASITPMWILEKAKNRVFPKIIKDKMLKFPKRKVSNAKDLIS